MACLLYPNGKIQASASFPSQTVEDLQLDRLAEAMSISEYYRVSAGELCALFTEDPAIICWRQAVIRDILQLSGLDEALSRLLDSLDGWEGRSSGRRVADSFAVGFSLEDFSWLEGYLRKVDASWAELIRFPVESEGLHTLVGLLDDLRNSPRYQSTAADFEALCSGHSAPATMRIGYNLDKELKPSRLKLLRMDPPAEKTAKGKGTQKRQMMLNQRAIEMDALLLQRLSAQASQDIGSFVIRETAVLRGLRRELVFCLSAAKLARSWQAAGLPVAFPALRPASEKAFSARDLFDPLLLISGKEQVVCNDAELQPGGELVFLTGANQGGKTVFLLSLGLCQWLTQLGFPIPAREAYVSPVKNILTIFAPNGQEYGRKGLLAEEAGRIAEAISNLTEESMLLFNEPLTSTGPEETKSISAEVAAVCMAAGARGIWVTHVYELAGERSALEAAVPWGSHAGSMRVVLEDEEGSPRFTYHVERGEPLGNSHADDALRRGGVVF